MSQFYHRIRDRIANAPFGFLIGPTIVIAAAAAIALRYQDTLTTTTAPRCRSIPGDSSWPTEDIWADLNRTVAGRLLAPLPIGAPCHKTVLGKPNPQYDEETCASLRANWFYPETHIPSPSSPMGYAFSGDSCNPFTTPDAPCTQGSHAVYAINASGVADFQSAVRFARERNVRLAIRNTGHDYLGKSAGAHALAVWTRHMKGLELVGYESESYTGPAIKMGAGVEVMEAYRFAAAHDLVVAGGNCPTVGFAGGFTQGGGHGPFASRHGLSADQVLEWEVVTGAGEVVTASATENRDLFWALRGGGGGTFGIVSSLTVKAFPDARTAMATLMIPNNGTNADVLYGAIATFLRDTLPGLVDGGVFVVWVAAPFGFIITPAIAPGLGSSELEALLQPFVERLDAMGLAHQYSATEYPTFLSSYEALQLTSSWNVSDYNIGSRFIPRDVATQDTEALVAAIRHISSQTLMSGVSYNLRSGISSSSSSSDDEGAINPYFRDALFSITVGTPVDYADRSATKAAQDKITHDLLPSLEKLTPEGAVYLNEADFQQPDFQKAIYGGHYQRLRDVKRKYDPAEVFYARTAVGSEEWAENEEGRLCRSGS
ncbi:hypothetical protein F4859DRAFT_477683 [Xylaria cf. heliscus]|nr:hypothetical protein F4859DRAFT_477683 [Xylaria cf. heliscus]